MQKARSKKLSKKDYVKTLLKDYPKGLGLHSISPGINGSIEDVIKLLNGMVANRELFSYKLGDKKIWKLP